MPHFTIEYSGNLDRHVDIGAVVEAGSQGRGRDRHLPARRYSRPRRQMRALCNRRRRARTTAFSTWCCGSAKVATSPTRKKAGEHIFKALSAYLDPVFANQKFALSFDMQINDKETSWKRNNIHEALKVETAHG